MNEHGLDTGTAYEVWVTLRRCADAGAAVLAITHDGPFLRETRVTGHPAFVRDGAPSARGRGNDRLE